MSSGNYFHHTVMVVEDYDDSRRMLTQFLVLAGYHVVEASNGREAVELVRRRCPDLILMDMNMPHLDGITATEQIRQCRDLCSKVAIVAVNAYDTEGMKEVAFRAGCNEYIKKPIDFDQLEKTISRILNR